MRRRFLFLFLVSLTAVLLSVPAHAAEAEGAASVDRIAPEEARAKVEAGEALLVCSYDDKTCQKLMLEGAIFQSEFEKELSSLSKGDEIIFYCG